ncbi:hypothetical protein [Luteirhabdus pelagi]|uniref:hypothetical protein n=1 Tax=Luteirhabdus pelagi TaxID=2792783 RepID=UPI00193A3C46|nr:hypothetical protein [Luteirhabdus pelagi]
MENRVPQLYPESFYFTDNPATLSQSSSQAFGPVVGNETTQYRTSSLFSVSGTQKAFAVCTGQVFLQPNSDDSSKVNLILRPYRQPIKGISIKYFIYRGLNKTDFIPTGDSILIGNNDLGGASEFLNVIWGHLKDFNDWDETTADANDFPAAWIGYDPSNQQPSSLIDDYFFKQSSFNESTQTEIDGFEMPMISKGVHLGNFTNDFGFEIVLNKGDYKETVSDTGFYFDLSYARANNQILNIENLPPDVAEKQYRETIHTFMDPAAYYGLHFKDNGKVWLAQLSSQPILKEGQAIYEDIVSTYFTRNKVYIHIQGHLGRSYNYYGTYSDLVGGNETIKIGIDAENMPPAQIYGTSGWPLIIHDEIQSHNNSVNEIHLQLLYQNDFSPILYGQLANLGMDAKNNFLTDEIETLSENELVNSGKFTTSFKLFFSAVNENSNSLNVSQFAVLLFKGSFVSLIDGNNHSNLKEFDQIFGLLNSENLIEFEESTINGFSYNRRQIIRVYDKNLDNSVSFIGKAMMIEDYLSFSDGIEEKLQKRRIIEINYENGIGKGLFFNSQNKNFSDTSFQIPITDKPGESYITIDSFGVEFFTLQTKNDFVIAVHQKEKNIKENPQMFVGIDNDEFNLLVEALQINPLRNTRLYFEEIETGVFRLEERYYIYELGIIGEDSTGTIQLIRPEEKILVYSVDEYWFYSKLFTQFMSNSGEEELSLNLELSL